MTLAVYREIDGAWEVLKTIWPPSGFPYVMFPAPLVVNGRSFIPFVATQRPRKVNGRYGEV